MRVLDQLIFADTVSKTYSFGWSQKRTLVITKERLYNINNRKVTRTLDLSKVEGISKTVNPNAKQEITIHAPTDYDYRIQAEK